MRSFICKLVYWIMLKLYVFILWALLPLLTMGKGILIQNVVIFDGKSEKTVTGNVWIEDNAIRKVSAEPIVAGAEVEVIDGRGKFLMPGLIDAHWHAYLAANTMVDLLTAYCRMDGFGSEDCAVGGIIARYWESKHLVSKLSTAKCNLSFSFQIPA